ncbi:MAG TPA: phosphoserine phosphatase SerB [Allosphingosinicella sp.]
MFIATLIAADRLTEQCVLAAGRLLMQAGCGPDRFEWLEPGSAATIAFQWQFQRARDALHSALEGVDAVVQSAGAPDRSLLIADMDSTMITVECIDELADYAGLKAEVATITERAMRGELDFERALDERVRLLAGMDAAAIDRCREERVRLTPGAKILVRTMKARGAASILVSGGFTRFAEPVAAEIGFDRVVANELEIGDGRLTGRVSRPLVGAAAKREALLAAARELGIGIQETLAVGDGANDIPMLEAAGLGIAYRAKPAARAAADAAIDHNDLTALLYAQGIPKSQWVTD